MKSIQKVTNTISRLLQRAELLIGSVMIVCLLVLMLTNAVARYIFDFPIIWSDEVNNFLFIWIGFLSCAYIMGEDKHMRVTAIVERLPQRVQAVIRIIMDVIMIVVFLYYLPPFFKLMGKVTYSGLLRLPLKYIYAILPLSFSLMAIHIVNNIVNELCALMQAGGRGKGA